MEDTNGMRESGPGARPAGTGADEANAYELEYEELTATTDDHDWDTRPVGTEELAAVPNEAVTPANGGEGS